jgi:hypothetical protein
MNSRKYWFLFNRPSNIGLMRLSIEKDKELIDAHLLFRTVYNPLMLIQVRSLIVTGCSSWTLYASPNYQVSLFLDKIFCR